MMKPELFAVRLAKELARDGYTASPGPPAGDYGWKLRIEGIRGAIVVYHGKKGPSLVLTELHSPPPELERVIRKAWERARMLTANAGSVPRAPARARKAIEPEPDGREPMSPSPALSARAAPLEPPATGPFETSPPTRSVELWVDGSYVAEGRRSAIGWAVLIVREGRELYRATGTDVPAAARSQRNVAGEILAVRHGLSWCREHGVPRACIYYDYEGLEAWVTGRWQARNPFTAAYACWVREAGVTVRWHKIRAHSGTCRNEQVDRLARQAAAAALSGLSGRDRSAASPPESERSAFDPEAGAMSAPQE